MKKLTIIDPPSGWKYGFPKPLPEGVQLSEWLLEQGYPEADIELAINYSRYWEEDEEEFKKHQRKPDYKVELA